jgi:hypothetical protein
MKSRDLIIAKSADRTHVREYFERDSGNPDLHLGSVYKNIRMFSPSLQEIFYISHKKISSGFRSDDRGGLKGSVELGIIVPRGESEQACGAMSFDQNR